ncbi:hypothetical protein BC567DRAFT_47546 [Phyllosticta citribraziliensis]
MPSYLQVATPQNPVLKAYAAHLSLPLLSQPPVHPSSLIHRLYTYLSTNPLPSTPTTHPIRQGPATTTTTTTTDDIDTAVSRSVPVSSLVCLGLLCDLISISHQPSSHQENCDDGGASGSSRVDAAPSLSDPDRVSRNPAFLVWPAARWLALGG